MQYREFGAGNARTVLLLHGGGLSWWNYRETAALLMQDHRVIVPVLDGHAGSDRPFTSIEENAAEIIAFIRANLGGAVHFIGGLSLGGQILLEMLAQQGDICRYALAESAMVIPSRMTHALIAPAFGSSYPLIRQRWFARMQFAQLRIKEALFEDYYRDTCAVSKRDMIAFLRANTAYRLNAGIRGCRAAVTVCCGEKENRGIRRSAEMIAEAIPDARLNVLAGLHHGEFSISHPQEYADTVRSVLHSGRGSGCIREL